MVKRFFILGILSLMLIGPSFSSAAEVGPPPPELPYIAGPPQLKSPEAGEPDVSLSPTFKWKGGVGAAGTYWYEINVLKYIPEKTKYEVTKQIDFLLEVSGWAEEITQTISGLPPNQDRWWWVRVCLESEKYCDNWSERRQFHTEEKAPPPIKDPGNGGGNGGGGVSILEIINPLNQDTLEGVINALINFLFVLAMGLAPLMIIYAAFLMLTSAEDPEKISKARQIILWTVVAVAVILLAKGLPALIKGALGG